jgi:hypothetical protein
MKIPPFTVLSVSGNSIYKSGIFILLWKTKRGDLLYTESGYCKKISSFVG